jgi:TonB family protein
MGRCLTNLMIAMVFMWSIDSALGANFIRISKYGNEIETTTIKRAGEFAYYVIRKSQKDSASVVNVIVNCVTRQRAERNNPPGISENNEQFVDVYPNTPNAEELVFVCNNQSSGEKHAIVSNQSTSQKLEVMEAELALLTAQYNANRWGKHGISSSSESELFKNKKEIRTSANQLIYPEEAKKKGEEGTVSIRALIDESGQVKSTNLIKSSGFGDLDIEADKWVRNTKFKPYLENGVPQSVYVQIPIRFKLDRSPAPAGLKIAMSDARSIGDRIRANTIYAVPDRLDTNDPVEYIVSLNKTGFVTDIKLLKSSGLVNFDTAVRHAIEKSQPFPADENGMVPSSFRLSHRPLEIP